MTNLADLEFPALPSPFSTILPEKRFHEKTQQFVGEPVKKLGESIWLFHQAVRELKESMQDNTKRLIDYKDVPTQNTFNNVKNARSAVINAFDHVNRELSYVENDLEIFERHEGQRASDIVNDLQGAVKQTKDNISAVILQWAELPVNVEEILTQYKAPFWQHHAQAASTAQQPLTVRGAPSHKPVDAREVLGGVPPPVRSDT
jgi:uncharacterized protein YoxC